MTTPTRLYISIDRSGDAPRYIASPDMHPGAEVWIPRDAVRVKPLEWEDVSDRCQDATGAGQIYRVISRADGTAELRHGVYGERVSYPTTSFAKAAAQADYEARILSALAALPAPPGAQEGE